VAEFVVAHYLAKDGPKAFTPLIAGIPLRLLRDPAD